MRRVVIAPDSFKGTIGAARAASALAEGWRDSHPEDEITLRPMADGGEGTLDAFGAAVAGAKEIPITVIGPDYRATEATWLLLPPTADAPSGTAVVELASTSGIELLRGRLRPWTAHTTGFGQAIAAALEHGVSRLILGIGSSASSDGGVGMLTTLGARFGDSTGNSVPDGAEGLLDLSLVDMSGLRPLPPGGVHVLSDVTNPLLGSSGAAAVFGPQKGLGSHTEIAAVEAGLTRLAALVPVDPSAQGAGAAGGVGWALLAWGARLVQGPDEVAELTGLRQALANAEIVLTGEGAFDTQSAAGKVPSCVAALASRNGVRAGLAAGRIEDDADTSRFASAVSLSDLAGSSRAAIADPTRWLRIAAVHLAQELASRRGT